MLPKRAKLRCMNLLKARAYTEKQLRDKLLQGEYTEKLIDVAIGYVKSYGYIDDRKYAEDYIAYHMENKNRKRMELDLYRKGIDRKLIGEILDGMQEGGKFPMNFLWLKKFLRKRIMTRKRLQTRKNRRYQRFIQKRIRYGYNKKRTFS